MANPTTNFGWVMPTNTDLVTDLPADFAVFGQGVDTSMAYLLGGTTGQILSKTSGTNMAFTWTTPNPGDITGVTAGTGISGGGTSGDVTVTNSMATAFTTSGDLIQATGSGTFARLATGTSGQYLTTNGTTNSWAALSDQTPLTTKGDLFGYSTLDARIPIGTNNQVLTADSAQALGLKWATPSAATSSYSLISTTSLSGATTITVSGLSGYSSLMILYGTIVQGFAGSSLSFRINADSATDYNYFGMNLTPTTAYAMSIFPPMTSTSQTNMNLGSFAAAADYLSGGIEILGANSTGVKTLKTINRSSTGGSGGTSGFYFGTYSGTSVVSSISFINSAASNFSNGTIYVYGSVV